eukprot:scaffold1079_cov191-Amphora_coffeaeformis.AAC.7
MMTPHETHELSQDQHWNEPRMSHFDQVPERRIPESIPWTKQHQQQQHPAFHQLDQGVARMQNPQISHTPQQNFEQAARSIPMHPTPSAQEQPFQQRDFIHEGNSQWSQNMHYPHPPGLYMNYYEQNYPVHIATPSAGSSTAYPQAQDHASHPPPSQARPYEDLSGVAQEPKPPAKRRKRDKNKPKRPLSAYNYFFKEERARMVAAANAPSGEGKQGDGRESVGFEHMAQAVSVEWRKANVKTLHKYETMAEKDLERYKNEMIAYRASHKASRETPTPNSVEDEGKTETPKENDDDSKDGPVSR